MGFKGIFEASEGKQELERKKKDAPDSHALWAVFKEETLEDSSRRWRETTYAHHLQFQNDLKDVHEIENIYTNGFIHVIGAENMLSLIKLIYEISVGGW